MKSVQRCVALAQLLIEQNFPAIAIHRGMTQEERLSRYQQFKDFQKVSSRRGCGVMTKKAFLLSEEKRLLPPFFRLMLKYVDHLGKGFFLGGGSASTSIECLSYSLHL